MTDRRTMIAGLFGAAFVAPSLRATEPPVHPAPDPKAVALWTSAALAKGMSDILHQFEQASGIRIAVTARGSDLAMTALYTGRADVALIGRAATDAERQAFEWVRQYPVTEIQLASTLPGGAPSVELLVHRGNPLAALSLIQLRNLLLAAKPQTWADLGVSGALGAKAVRIHMPATDSGTGRFLRAKLTGGANQLAWKRIVEHAGDDAAADIARAVALDPAAIGLGGVASPGLRIVPIETDGTPLPPEAHAYPLRRNSYLYLERPIADVRPAVGALAQFLSKVGV